MLKSAVRELVASLPKRWTTRWNIFSGQVGEHLPAEDLDRLNNLPGFMAVLDKFP